MRSIPPSQKAKTKQCDGQPNVPPKGDLEVYKAYIPHLSLYHAPFTPSIHSCIHP